MLIFSTRLINNLSCLLVRFFINQEKSLIFMKMKGSRSSRLCTIARYSLPSTLALGHWEDACEVPSPVRCWLACLCTRPCVLVDDWTPSVGNIKIRENIKTCLWGSSIFLMHNKLCSCRGISRGFLSYKDEWSSLLCMFKNWHHTQQNSECLHLYAWRAI